jgi:tetratricopeptide (TPR) repeat protein
MPGILKELGVESTAPVPPPDQEAPPEQVAFEPDEQRLELAAAQAEKRKAPPKERIRLWLELAELHRRIAVQGTGGQKRARLKQAELVVRRALEIAAQAQEKVGYLDALDALAEVFSALNNLPSTERALQEAIRLEAALRHPDAVRMARRTHLLGNVYHRAGKLDDAVPVLERSVKLYEDKLGSSCDETVRVLADLGALHRARKRYDLAQRCLHHALRYFQKAKGVSSPEAIATLSQLASSYAEGGDRESSARECQRMLTLLEQEVGRNQEELGEMEFVVASLYISWGDYARAREVLGDCLGAFRRIGGPRLAVGHETLAQVEEALGHYSDAARELAAAGKVWAQCGNRNAELATNLTRRVELMELLKRPGEADWLRQRLAELDPRHSIKRMSSA